MFKTCTRPVGKSSSKNCLRAGDVICLCVFAMSCNGTFRTLWLQHLLFHNACGASSLFGIHATSFRCHLVDVKVDATMQARGFCVFLSLSRWHGIIDHTRPFTDHSISPTVPVMPLENCLTGTAVANASLVFLERFGTGTDSAVYRAIDSFSCSPQICAVRCSPKSEPHALQSARRRGAFLHREASMAHPHIIRFRRLVQEDSRIFLLMDFCPSGNLHDAIQRRVFEGDNGKVKVAFAPLLDALEECHRLGIYHQNIKLSNILCSEDGSHLWLSGFTYATTDETSPNYRYLSGPHVSPGMLFSFLGANLPSQCQNRQNLFSVSHILLQGDSRPQRTISGR